MAKVIVKTSEHDMQVACVNWFRLKYPKYLIYAIPNGSQRNIIVATKLKAEGVTSGIPDLHIPIAKNGYHGLYIEMKTGKNKPTENQLTIMDKLRNEGHKCVVCYSLDEFMKEVKTYLD